ncbi:FAD-dependent oxidoreductase [Candidatus Woesearchaeota archaeon]|nr:FAD-dependent oxidoreductase [Candidatus Woesearchaeota archaeon]
MKVKAVVKEVVQETPRVRLVRLVWEGVQSFSFRPGQWVGVWCDDFLGDNGKPLRRAFSIASSPGDAALELCVSRGKGFSAFLQDLAPGAIVNVDGPYGGFWLRPAEKYLFIAGGTGIAPFRSMIAQTLAAGREVLLLYSMKMPSDFVYRMELEGLRANKNFTMVPTITADHDFPAWEGKRGRVQKLLPSYWQKGWSVYVCGPPAMVEDLQVLLFKLGQPKELLFVDKWE